MVLELKAKLRTDLGRKAKNLVKEGFLPAVVYGEGVPSRSISVGYKDFEKVYRSAGESTIVTLDCDGKTYNVLIHEVVQDPLKNIPTHADFYAIRMDKELKLKVPVEFIGESFAVKSEGGILVKVMQEIEVEALPKDLPHSIVVDISKLATVNSRISVGELSLPAGVRVVAEADDIVVLVEPPRSEEELKAQLSTEAPEAPVEEVKTEKELKTEEEAAKKAALDAAEKD